MSETFRNEFEKIRINRNIVECKYQCGTDDVFQIIRINRNIVECKFLKLKTS